MCLSLYRSCLDFYLSLGTEQTENLTGQRPFVCFGTPAVILNFAFERQYFFSVLQQRTRW